MRFELPEDKKLTFEMIIPVRWGDMDAMGHVNNTIYFRYFESVRIEWLRRIGGAPDLSGQGPVIVNAFCNFLKQLTYPGDVLARHYVGAAGRTSFETFVTLQRTDAPGVIHAEGGAQTVWIDYSAQKPVPLPAWLRAVCDGAPPAEPAQSRA